MVSGIEPRSSACEALFHPNELSFWHLLLCLFVGNTAVLGPGAQALGIQGWITPCDAQRPEGTLFKIGAFIYHIEKKGT